MRYDVVLFSGDNPKTKFSNRIFCLMHGFKRPGFLDLRFNTYTTRKFEQGKFCMFRVVCLMRSPARISCRSYLMILNISRIDIPMCVRTNLKGMVFFTRRPLAPIDPQNDLITKVTPLERRYDISDQIQFSSKDIMKNLPYLALRK